ncbi:MAG: N-6 DNA methylase [Tissierellia bacterium]|nr:N-6 DNA methylase [Bacteroidales bacterium]MDD4089123.1 N-6 DNA methylase [Tissierellia bacterium]
MGNLHENSSDSTILNEGLAQLGLASEKDEFLFFVQDKETYSYKPALWFQLEKAEFYQANAVFFKKGIREDELIPQIYIYDYTSFPLANKELLTEIHKKVWTGGEIPIVCVFSKTEIIILDTTKPIKEREGSFAPAYLVENLKQVTEVHKQIYGNLAQQLKSGTYWDRAEIDFYKDSSYSQLTTLLRKVINKFTAESGLVERKDVVQKLIIQCILIKYLEERRDENDNTVFPKSFFENYGGAQQFSDVLINGQLFNFFDYLNKDHFNGGIFNWDDDDKLLIEGKQDAFNYLADVLRGYIDTNDQHILEFPDNFSRLYSFNHIPVELISRLYEEFIIKENKKRKLVAESGDLGEIKNDGVAYTPSHLVKLLVNEAMPLNESPKDLKDFKVLDPACGSAIFLVVVFKRLVQWWRLKNNYKNPKLDDLKLLLNAVYGVDSDPKAVQISVFSLSIALCDELSPKEIWEDLKFDNLEGNRIFGNDFFYWKKEIPEELKFDIIIGNPPFKYDEKKNYLWKPKESYSVQIPRNQIALRFLSESLDLLKDKGLSCLILKASPLLYTNSKTAERYLQALTCNFHINQIFDFTPLARNGVLWDGADVDTAAIFVTNVKPDYNKNVLHAIFRRTKANKERIYFEIDKYDLYFILRNEVYENPYVFKTNLLGGGRINQIIKKYLEYDTLTVYLKKHNCEMVEGFIAGNQNKSLLEPEYIYQLKLLPTDAFKENNIDDSKLTPIDRNTRFRSFPKDKIAFEYPNILIKKNVGNVNHIPIFLNKSTNFAFKDKIIGIYSKTKDINVLSRIYSLFVKNMDVFRFFSLVTSAQALITKNTVLLKEDIERLPISEKGFNIDTTEKNIIDDVLKYTQYFIRRPETAEALNPLDDIMDDIGFYGKQFSGAINELYADDSNSFKLTDIILFERENLIGTLFSYDNKENYNPNLIKENEVTLIDGLVNFDINESLTATRIIQYYAPNKVLFVKPNQKRYWLASIAYRDADSVFADILNSK